MVNDLVSDMLTRIRNSSRVKHKYTRVYYSNFCLAIVKVLISEGYLKTYEIEEKNNKPYSIKIFLKYKGWWIKKPFFATLTRISKPGKRVFSSYNDFSQYINTLRYKQGTAIISTSMGVMTHSKAERLKIGGEIIGFID